MRRKRSTPNPVTPEKVAQKVRELDAFCKKEAEAPDWIWGAITEEEEQAVIDAWYAED